MSVFRANSQLCPLCCLVIHYAASDICRTVLPTFSCLLHHFWTIFLRLVWEFQQRTNWPAAEGSTLQFCVIIFCSSLGLHVKFNSSLQFSLFISAFFALMYLISIIIVRELDAIFISPAACKHARVTTPTTNR